MRRLIFLKVLVLIPFLLSSVLVASSFYKPVPLKSFTGKQAAPWEFIEQHHDPSPGFTSQLFHPKLYHFYQQTELAFGNTKPHSSYFLLYAAPGWDEVTYPHPVLLIPGANDDATRRFAFPLSPMHPDHQKFPGLMQYLSKKGFAVFSISFSHFHGDNIFQGEQIANAIKRIRKLLGRDEDPDFKVDLVTFSKGAMAARCYAENAFSFYDKKYTAKFFTPYQGNIRRIVFQCAPLAGMDLPYRYYMYNMFLQQNKVPAPMGAEKILLYGKLQSAGINFIHSGYWTGQLQMIHDQKLIGVPDSPFSWTADNNQTMIALKYGGQTLFLKARGLEAARLAGGNLIEKLNELGLPEGIEFSVLAGTHPITYDDTHPTWKIPVGGDPVYTNDGLLFLNSAHYVKGLTVRGAKLLQKMSLAENHIDLSRSKKAYKFVFEQLKTR
ncbi:esterase/lipase family protein [Candidatus Riflebacteria bacterium]